MVSLTSLALPIVVAAVLVFLASFVVHMVFTYHWSDFRKLPDEDGVMGALGKFKVPQGDYMVPHPQNAQGMRSPEYLAKVERGPVFIGTFYPAGRRGMGAQLGQWFVFCLVVSIFAAYMASRSLPAGAEYLRVSQMASTTAFIGYALARWSDVIWYKRSVSTALKATFDGLLYGMITGGAVGWLWPR